MAPKGKQGTKGQKQILQENVETLAFYRNMIVIVGSFYGTTTFLLFKDIPTFDWVLIVFAAIVFAACYKFMASMSAPKYGADNSILDEGCDLNIEGGLAEHVKDLIILTSGCVVFAVFSTYAWLIWLLAPARAFHLVWVNILSPYFFQPGVEEPTEEVNNKKQRKMERKFVRRR